MLPTWTIEWDLQVRFLLPLNEKLILNGFIGGELYYGSNYARLLDLKNQYDPDSVFALPEGWEA